MSDVHDLTGPDFLAMLKAGHYQLKQNVQHVNALNVFPVPDGDTGTNMELSFASGIAHLQAMNDWSLAKVAREFANGLLMGARGNSGVILSQLFRGFLKATQNTEKLSSSAFASALYEGVQIAYRAVSKPVEGTILTVAREAALYGVKTAKSKESLADWLTGVYDSAQKALAKTPEQLPVLKQAGVVDSGGQGFVYILGGFLQSLQGGLDVLQDMGNTLIPHDVNIHFAAADIHRGVDHGYCTEVLIRSVENTMDAQEKLRQIFSEYGDSLLVVGADSYLKVHVHTLNPGRVLEDAIKYGPLVKIKIENMSEQHDAMLQSPSFNPETGHGEATLLQISDEPKEILRDVAVIVVSAGAGLSEVFLSLGVDAVVSGGQTFNPSTEELVSAISQAQCQHTILLPNHKNVILTANQARTILGEDHVTVVPSQSVLHGIAALMAYQPNRSVEENVQRMLLQMQEVQAGQVVRAVRDSMYQNQAIREGQYLGLVNEELLTVQDARLDIALELVQHLKQAESELVTLFYGEDVPVQEIELFCHLIRERYHLETEIKFGGQPVYDYIFTVE